MVPPLVTLEEHFFSTTVANSLDDKYAEQFKAMPGVPEQLRDLGSLRLEKMEAGKVSLQIISHAPGAPNPQQCKEANDQLAQAVKQHPDRFAG